MDILNALKQLRDDIKTWVTNNLNALNAKIDEKTIPIDNKLDSTSTNPVQNKVVTKAINNIPTFSGSYNDLTDAPNISEDESGNMVIADESGNIIFKADADGIHTTAVSLNGEAAASEKYVDDAIANIDIPEVDFTGYATEKYVDDAIAAIPETDLTGYATEKYVDDAVAAIDIPETDLSDYYTKEQTNAAINTAKEEISESIVAESDEWKVVDEAGNIIFSVDASGAHTTALTLNGESVEDIVDERVAALVDSAPDTLNTLNELANALGDDPNFATTVATEIGKKVDKVDGKGLSTNDFTNEYKEKLEGLENITFEESDPTVPAWAKEATKPTYTADEVGLGNVNNTSDLDKPVSTATQDAIDGLRDELSESITSENNEWKIVDSSGNIVFSVDSQGAHTTNLLLNDEEVATKAYVDDKTSNNMAKPDWNENDETKGSYIKNRTHWMEVSLGTPLIENVEVVDNTFIPFAQYDESTIQESKQYIFEINGVQYPATYIYDDDRPSKSIIANGFEFIYEYSSSEYGCSLSYKGDNPIEEPYNVSIYEAQIVYHKIDKNFLPEGIDGYTPVRGIDYWTDADKAEIKSYVDEAILGGAW